MHKEPRKEVRKAVEEELRARLMLVVIELAKELGVTKICTAVEKLDTN